MPPQDRRRRADDHVVSRLPLRIALALTLVMSGLAWIVTTHPWSGPTVLAFSETHGVHMNDWLTVVLWAAAVAVARPSWAAARWRRLQRAIADRSA